MSKKNKQFSPNITSELLKSKIENLFNESIEIKRKTLEKCSEQMIEISDEISKALIKGNKILLCGNGGSASDAQHLAAELLIRLRSNINRQSLPAIALTMDTSSLTASGNDYSFEEYYARIIEALSKPGDLLIAITTSGKSQNIINALKMAQSLKITTIGLLGSDGGNAINYCDLKILVPSNTPGRVQESHITIGHCMMELVEDIILDKGFIICN